MSEELPVVALVVGFILVILVFIHVVVQPFTEGEEFIEDKKVGLIK